MRIDTLELMVVDEVVVVGVDTLELDEAGRCDYLIHSSSMSLKLNYLSSHLNMLRKQL